MRLYSNTIFSRLINSSQTHTRIEKVDDERREGVKPNGHDRTLNSN